MRLRVLPAVNATWPAFTANQQAMHPALRNATALTALADRAVHAAHAFDVTLTRSP